jgi:hypothetical protein
MIDSISLREFIAGLSGLPRQGRLWPEAVPLMLNACGPQNAHLSRPADSTTGKPNRYDRDTPLSLEERVYGDYLLLTYCGHDPSLILSEHGSLEELRAQIVGPAGSLNCWINAQFAFHKLKPLPFAIHYTDRFGERKVFSIDHPEPGPFSLEDLELPLYQNVHLEWVRIVNDKRL